MFIWLGFRFVFSISSLVSVQKFVMQSFLSDFLFLRNSCANPPRFFLSLKIEQFHLYRRK